MILLKQSLNEDFLGKIALDIASRAQAVVSEELYQYYGRCKHIAPFTTLALFIKEMFRDYFRNGRNDYTILDVMDIADNIASLSGSGRDKEYSYYWDSEGVVAWGWAFVKALATVSERSEDLQMATSLWRRHEDGSAIMGDTYSDIRAFLLEKSDYHDSWSRDDCGVVEKWYDKADESTHYFPYKVFATENEARLFIAELIMKINAPWYPLLEKAEADILDEMANVYVNDAKAIDEEFKRMDKAEQAVGNFHLSRAQVYIMNFTDGVQKIGVSNNPIVRTRTKEKESGRLARDVCATDVLPGNDSFKIEKQCHADLNKYRIGKSEFFTCTNEQARATLEKYSPITFYKKFI